MVPVGRIRSRLSLSQRIVCSDALAHDIAGQDAAGDIRVNGSKLTFCTFSDNEGAFCKLQIPYR
jgi:hypothetical protein